MKLYSLRTEKSYVDWIKRFIWFHGKRHPKEMGAPEVEAFLSLWQWKEGLPLPPKLVPATLRA